MDLLLITLILILLALLGARFSFSTEGIPSGPRLLFRTGTHFLLAGFVLGPHVLGILTLDSMDQLFPLLTLGLGWVGFLFGLQLDRDNLTFFPPAYHAVALGQAALTFLFFAGVAWAILAALGMLGEVETLVLLVTAATACVTTPAGVAVVSSNFMVRGKVRELLFFIASVDALFGIAVLEILHALYRPPGMLHGMEPGGEIAWVLAALGLGVVFGILFLWLSPPQSDRKEIVLFLLGIAALSGGAALLLHLTPLFVCMVSGAVVANLSPDRQRIFDVLEEWEKPIYLILLLLAGAFLRIPTPWIFALAGGYLVIRAVGKILGAGLASRLPLDFNPPVHLGLGLLPQGGISLAMAISVILTYQGLPLNGLDAMEIFFGVVVLGVVASELVGPFFLTRLLRQEGEISARVEEALQRGDEAAAHREAIQETAPGSSRERREDE